MVTVRPSCWANSRAAAASTRARLRAVGALAGRRLVGTGQVHGTILEIVAVPLLLAVGGLLALQAAANVQLSAAMASPLGASTLQLGVGAVLLLALAAVAGSLGARVLLEQAEPWHLLGGLGSAVSITAAILLFPRLGALAAVGLFIAGQMLASLVLDGFGWLGVAREPLDLAAVTGAAAVVAGTWLIVGAQAGGEAIGRALRQRREWIALGLVAGAVLPVQGAVNAQLRAELGAAPVVALTVGGQQLASVAVDRYGLLRLARRPISRRRLLGVAVLLAGVALLTPA
jgi:transporter family-2 protein